MTINISMPKSDHDLRPRITVVGVGGAGGNAVNNMIRADLEGVNFVVCNTDAQALEQSLGERKIQLGVGITRGLGAGSRPDVGRASAEEALDEILDHISSSHMVFITAGMGGGTGTGAAPVIAQAAREQGILTVGVITKPFQFEGSQRMKLAEAGIEELQQYVDTLLIIPNQNLFRVANEKTTFADAFKMADDVLYSGVRGVTDLMIMPGHINLDFADIRTVMSEMGKAMMGTGEAEGDKRAINAAEAAISNPLLDEVTMKGARGILINITGGNDMTLFEVDEAANRIREEVYSEALIIFGSTFDESLNGKIRVSMVATGIDIDDSGKIESEPRGLAGPIPSVTQLPSITGGTERSLTESSEQESVTERKTGIEVLSRGGIELTEGQVADETMPPLPPTHVEYEIDTSFGAPQTKSGMENEARGDAVIPDTNDASQTINKREPFIPPRPTVVSPQDKEERQAEPFAAAAIENAGTDTQPKRRRGLTLFERMTGAGKNRDKQQNIADEKLESLTTSNFRISHATDIEKSSTPQSHEPSQQTVTPQQPETFEATQSAFRDLDGEIHEPSSSAEEEMLEIPAFLRRQAN